MRSSSSWILPQSSFVKSRGRAKGVARPLRVYGWLEIGVAAFALILPLLLRLVNEAYVSAAISLGGTHGVIDAARPLMAFPVLVLSVFGFLVDRISTDRILRKHSFNFLSTFPVSCCRARDILRLSLYDRIDLWQNSAAR